MNFLEEIRCDCNCWTFLPNAGEVPVAVIGSCNHRYCSSFPSIRFLALNYFSLLTPFNPSTCLEYLGHFCFANLSYFSNCSAFFNRKFQRTRQKEETFQTFSFSDIELKILQILKLFSTNLKLIGWEPLTLKSAAKNVKHFDFNYVFPVVSDVVHRHFLSSHWFSSVSRLNLLR